MRRRDFIVVLAGSAAAWPFVVRAQQTRPAKLGVLLVEKREPFSRIFWEGLRELGYIDGQNMQIEYRSAEGKLDRLPTLAAELVDLKVDIIVASETPAVQAAKRATTEIPIVMAPSGDPVGTAWAPYRRIEVRSDTGLGVLVSTEPDDDLTGVVHRVQAIVLDLASGEIAPDGDPAPPATRHADATARERAVDDLKSASDQDG